jgi:hypothetical protein
MKMFYHQILFDIIRVKNGVGRNKGYRGGRSSFLGAP